MLESTAPGTWRDQPRRMAPGFPSWSYEEEIEGRASVVTPTVVVYGCLMIGMIFFLDAVGGVW